MQLVADRFLVSEHDGRALDLATGERVCLRITSAGGPTEQARWAERCAWLTRVVHPALASLVDYGSLGASTRFEAWEARASWTGSVAAARSTAAQASRFLEANGRTVEEGEVVADRSGRARLIPGAGAAIARADDDAGPFVSGDAVGIVRPVDARLAAVGEMLAEPGPSRLVAFAVWAPDRRAIEDAVRALARSVRLAGYIPVHTSLRGDVGAHASGRSLCLVATGVHEGWRALINVSLVNPKPHMLLFATAVPVRRVHTIRVQPVPADALMAAVAPAGAARAQLRRIATAARRSRGWPHRFEQLLLGEPYAPPDRSVAPLRRSAYGRQADQPARAAEPSAVYAAQATGTPDRACAIRPPGWSPPGEIVRLRRHYASGRALLQDGRLRPAERTLRQVMHAFGRRGEWREAADSGLLLAQALLSRGRVVAADDLLRSVCAWVEQAADVPISERAGLLRAQVLLEQGRAPEAESLLETVLASAASVDTGHIVDATLALGRCLYWQGRYGDAWQRLSLLEPDTANTPRHQVRLLIARSRVAIGLDRVAEAVACGARARDCASSLDDPGLVAAAQYACALAQLAAGDAVQADAAAVQAASAAARAHDPMLTLIVRLLRADIARRQGHRAAATLLVRRTMKVATALPATVRGRIEVLRELLNGADATLAAERAAGTGGALRALRLFVPCARAQPKTSVSPDEIAELMASAHAAEDDRLVLASIGARLRGRLRAAGVAFFGCDAAQTVCVCADGSRVDPETALRILAASTFVPPHPGERIEAGVPIRYAGRVVGALAAVWTPGASWSVDDLSLLLSVAATAAGPALSGLIARRSAASGSRAAELIGVSRAMADVRQAIERAAAAPFAVLVEGESGSGKELVARLLHKLGPRRDRPFCTLNCAALPEDLVESELFGHARGAFTGAAAEHRGVFEEAHTGTLFLDEIGELSARAQAKLLRAIQEGEIRRVGDNVCRRVDVRLVTATNRDLRVEVTAERFRADLLYRLDVIRITLPSLRDRRDDIVVLAEHYWREAASRVDSRAVLGASTLAALTQYDWPGNIRELQNVLAALAVRVPKRGIVSPNALPPHFNGRAVAQSFRLDEARRTFDRSFVRAALARAGGQRARAAAQLGVSRQGLGKLMTRLGIADETATEGR